jgi:hypothetical protein
MSFLKLSKEPYVKGVPPKIYAYYDDVYYDDNIEFYTVFVDGVPYCTIKENREEKTISINTNVFSSETYWGFPDNGSTEEKHTNLQYLIFDDDSYDMVFEYKHTCLEDEYWSEEEE